MKLPVPCAPGEENETDAGGGASGDRPGAGGTSGVGALCAPALSDRRAGLSLSRPCSGRSWSRPRASPAAVTPGGGSSRALPRADAAAAACGWVTGAWQLALSEQLCDQVFGVLSGRIACGITRGFFVILRKIFPRFFGVVRCAAGDVADPPLCGSAPWVGAALGGATAGGGGGGGGDTGSGITGVTTGTATVGGTIGVGGACGTTGVDASIATCASEAPSTGTPGTESASAFGTATAATSTAPITAA